MLDKTMLGTARGKRGMEKSALCSGLDLQRICRKGKRLDEPHCRVRRRHESVQRGKRDENKMSIFGAETRGKGNPSFHDIPSENKKTARKRGGKITSGG